MPASTRGATRTVADAAIAGAPKSPRSTVSSEVTKSKMSLSARGCAKPPLRDRRSVGARKRKPFPEPIWAPAEVAASTLAEMPSRRNAERRERTSGVAEE